MKGRLQKPLNDTNWDGRIIGALTDASTLINKEIQKWTAVPLSTVPDMIAQIANDWATGLLLEEDTQPTSQNPQVVQTATGEIYPGGAMNVFLVRAKANLKRFIVITYMTP